MVAIINAKNSLQVDISKSNRARLKGILLVKERKNKPTKGKIMIAKATRRCGNDLLSENWWYARIESYFNI